MYIYYDKTKIQEGKLRFVTITDVPLEITPDNTVLYVGEKVFSGYPIIVPSDGTMFETIRKATDVELIDLGVKKLRDDQEIKDGVIVQKPIPLETIKLNTIDELTKVWEVIEAQPVPLNGVNWKGGYDSAQKFDAVRRMAIEYGNVEVTYYDTLSKGYTVDIPTATQITIFVATVYEVGFGAYQKLIVEIEEATSEQECYDILLGNEANEAEGIVGRVSAAEIIKNSIQEFFLSLMPSS